MNTKVSIHHPAVTGRIEMTSRMTVFRHERCERISAARRKWSRPLLLALFFLLPLLIDFSCGAALGQAEKLLFLGNKNIAPVVYLEDGEPVGVVVDIVRALAPHLPRPVEIRAMDWQEAQDLVAKGEADALMQINRTEERLRIYDFSEPLLESQFAIFFATNRVGISGISSLRGLTVGVESGGLPQLELGKEPQINLEIIPSFLEGFQRITQGTLDAVVVDSRVGSYILAENKIRGIKISEEPVAVSFSAIAVQKGDAKLLAVINEALRIIKSDGTYQQVLDKWQTTEVIFRTRAQISHKRYAITILVFFVLLSIAALWLMTLRRQLAARKLAEEQVRTQYSTLRGIIDSANTPIFSVDRGYCYTSFNKGHATVMENIYGARVALGRRFLDYMTVPEDRETAKRNLDRAMAGEYFVTEVCSGETLRFRQYFQVAHNPVKDDKGMVIGVAVFAQDMTAIKELEEDRLANFRFFENMDRVNRAIQGATNLEQLMSDVLDEVLSIFDCDRAYFLFPCDPDAATWMVPMERTRPEYPGALELKQEMPMVEEVAATFRILLAAEGVVKFGPGNVHPVPADVAEHFQVKSFMAMTLRPKIGPEWQFGIHQCSRLRAWTPEEEKLYNEIGRRLEDGLSTLLFYRDLKDSEKRFRTLINQAADAFVLHDMEGRILDVNQTTCESLGYTREELLTMSVADLDAEFISHEHVKNFWSKLTSNQPVTLEGKHKRKDGTIFPVEVRLGLLQIEKRQVILALARDISERKEAEETLRQLNEELETRVNERTAEMENKGRELLDSRQALMNLVADLNDNAAQLAAANAKLQELDRLKSMFIASMSHELRTPLNSIIGFSSILAEEWLGSVTEEQKKNLLTVHRAGQHLLALVNDVIDVSKIEAGKLEVTVSDFDLAEVLVEATSLFAGEIRDKALELQADSLHLQMRTDRRRLTQCLINLLSNAVKYTDWGSIRLAARRFTRENGDAGPWLEITVTDTGMGIRDEDLPLLFNAFVRLPLPADKSIRGTGLGLYLTKKIVCETLRGQIGVESVFGQGSCFSLRIPVQLKNGNGNEQGNE